MEKSYPQRPSLTKTQINAKDHAHLVEPFKSQYGVLYELSRPLLPGENACRGLSVFTSGVAGRNKMQFLGGNRRKLRLADDQRNACYPHSLLFYLQPPSGNISLIEFENLAIDRVKLLKAVKSLGVSYVKGTEQYQRRLEAELRKLKFSCRESVEDEYEPRRRDHISHFILHLAYCQSEEVRRWFIQQEMNLLLFQFSILPKDKIQSFLKDSHLQFEAISDEEKTLRGQDIVASSHSLGGAQLESVYVSSFADALDLFQGRKVYLENGFAYVQLKDIVAIILNEFKTNCPRFWL
ncbi:DNA primase large subunit-like [Pontoporia blainvillei]|uniref:DNA primase large subunit-like n=1 Tax=Pontoporia blainvillei TaxID=48723 RepID=A0ABX0S7G3_PONBL|nr:DNA primase large subunit-like [Pontoporia blainvillei]